mmetsp:Transcript_41560/g.50396  ORF Transcript_41560/g.50396 Transcript_41560/m.50396 type:complete len:327 (-) Transcript_41560:556-1536(-)|eukprot:CAMPEP_0197849410 /NCGR_PEP_ID=MMETSP1438-20131217/11944_1 /TAXON_ID=1461541 /ORGANISM="Pterosperma sp., Strain CCMP1384" /LENGTH=326 /DNA_ID=CAMNT_0043462075 /DNA_START=176 /DNA_END=1156 /DNA_ORIENTATION=+
MSATNTIACAKARSALGGVSVKKQISVKGLSSVGVAQHVKHFEGLSSRPAVFASRSSQLGVMAIGKGQKAQAASTSAAAAEEPVVQEVVATVTPVAPVHPPAQPGMNSSFLAVGGLLAGTFGWALYQVYQKTTSPNAKRARVVHGNRLIVGRLSQFLPENRLNLTSAVVRQICFKTGCTKDQVFRKYLRYLLDQRKFDQEAVADLLHLRQVCTLADEHVQEILLDTAERTYAKTGMLMLQPTGMDARMLHKKAVGRAAFSKLLYLADSEQLLPTTDREDLQVTIMKIFGATSEDAAKLRIYSLSEFDVNQLERLMGTEPKTDAYLN